MLSSARQAGLARQQSLPQHPPHTTAHHHHHHRDSSTPSPTMSSMNSRHHHRATASMMTIPTSHAANTNEMTSAGATNMISDELLSSETIGVIVRCRPPESCDELIPTDSSTPDSPHHQRQSTRSTSPKPHGTTPLPVTLHPATSQIQILTRESKRQTSGTLLQRSITPNVGPTLTTFAYDAVIGGVQSTGARNMNDSQPEVFQHCIPLVESVLQGYNSTIFCYGQSGAGKTYTTEGELANTPRGSIVTPLASNSSLSLTAGILPRSLEHLLHRIKAMKAASQIAEYTIRATYVEIYNEVVYDLLGGLNVVSVSENPKTGSFYVKEARDIALHSMRDVIHAIKIGSKHKRMADTLLNAHSSRSHTIFTIYIEMHQWLDSNKETSIMRVGKLNLVDLAGSERLSASRVEGIHKREAASINQSLFALGRCITALSQLQQLQHISSPSSLSSPPLLAATLTSPPKRSHHRRLSNPSMPTSDVTSPPNERTHSRRSSLTSPINTAALFAAPVPTVDAVSAAVLPHIPYRTSKLTMLLKDSLGGNSRTLLIACIRPELEFFDSTSSTLRFASLLKKIHNRPIVNEDPRDQILRKLQEENARLVNEMSVMRGEMSRIQSSNGSGMAQQPNWHAGAASTSRDGASSMDLDRLIAPWATNADRTILKQWLEAATNSQNGQNSLKRLSMPELRQLLSFLPSAASDIDPASRSSIPTQLWSYTPSGYACSLSVGLSPRRHHRKLLPTSLQRADEIEEKMSGGLAEDQLEQDQEEVEVEEIEITEETEELSPQPSQPPPFSPSSMAALNSGRTGFSSSSPSLPSPSSPGRTPFSILTSPVAPLMYPSPNGAQSGTSAATNDAKLGPLNNSGSDAMKSKMPSEPPFQPTLPANMVINSGVAINSLQPIRPNTLSAPSDFSDSRGTSVPSPTDRSQSYRPDQQSKSRYVANQSVLSNIQSQPKSSVNPSSSIVDEPQSFPTQSSSQTRSRSFSPSNRLRPSQRELQHDAQASSRPPRSPNDITSPATQEDKTRSNQPGASRSPAENQPYSFANQQSAQPQQVGPRYSISNQEPMAQPSMDIPASYFSESSQSQSGPSFKAVSSETVVEHDSLASETGVPSYDSLTDLPSYLRPTSVLGSDRPDSVTQKEIARRRNLQAQVMPHPQPHPSTTPVATVDHTQSLQTDNPSQPTMRPPPNQSDEHLAASSSLPSQPSTGLAEKEPQGDRTGTHAETKQAKGLSAPGDQPLVNDATVHAHNDAIPLADTIAAPPASNIDLLFQEIANITSPNPTRSNQPRAVIQSQPTPIPISFPPVQSVQPRPTMTSSASQSTVSNAPTTNSKSMATPFKLVSPFTERSNFSTNTPSTASTVPMSNHNYSSPPPTNVRPPIIWNESPTSEPRPSLEPIVQDSKSYSPQPVSSQANHFHGSNSPPKMDPFIHVSRATAPPPSTPNQLALSSAVVSSLLQAMNAPDEDPTARAIAQRTANHQSPRRDLAHARSLETRPMPSLGSELGRLKHMVETATTLNDQLNKSPSRLYRSRDYTSPDQQRTNNYKNDMDPPDNIRPAAAEVASPNTKPMAKLSNSNKKSNSVFSPPASRQHQVSNLGPSPRTITIPANPQPFIQHGHQQDFQIASPQHSRRQPRMNSPTRHFTPKSSSSTATTATQTIRRRSPAPVVTTPATEVIHTSSIGVSTGPLDELVTSSLSTTKLIRRICARLSALEKVQSTAASEAEARELELRLQNALLRERIEQVNQHQLLAAVYDQHIQDHPPSKSKSSPLNSSRASPKMRSRSPTKELFTLSRSSPSKSPSHPSHHCASMECHAHQALKTHLNYMSTTTNSSHAVTAAFDLDTYHPLTHSYHPPSTINTSESSYRDDDTFIHASQATMNQFHHLAQRAQIIKQQQYEQSRHHVQVDKDANDLFSSNHEFKESHASPPSIFSSPFRT